MEVVKERMNDVKGYLCLIHVVEYEMELMMLDKQKYFREHIACVFVFILFVY